MSTKYEIVIGLEIHARIKTNSKLFCSCSNDVFDKAPNSHICPVCSGFPGQLPVLNEEAMKKIILTGKSLGCEIPSHSKFDRKSYFYPDLPSGYQISQYDEPICGKGSIEMIINGEKKRFGIHRIHLENDAGKLSHTDYGTEVDLNRAGCPLMEIVTEPDFRSSTEVKMFLQELQKILRTIDSSDADMEKGQMRADVNISLRQLGENKYGTRCEIKNMNSFSSIEKAIIYEYERQSKILNNGEIIAQETRGFDDNKGITVSQRSKEEAADYRYFPEPDLPLLIIEKDFLDSIKVPELPLQKYERLEKEYGIKKDDAFIFAGDKDLAEYFEETGKLSGDGIKSANWILSELMRFTNEDLIGVKESKVTPKHISEIIKMINSGEISGKIAKEIFPEIYNTGISPVKIVEEKGLKQNSNTDELEKICKEVILENAKIVEEYKSGKEKVFGALVGMVMKKTQGQANPQIVNDVLKKCL